MSTEIGCSFTSDIIGEKLDEWKQTVGVERSGDEVGARAEAGGERQGEGEVAIADEQDALGRRLRTQGWQVPLCVRFVMSDCQCDPRSGLSGD